MGKLLQKANVAAVYKSLRKRFCGRDFFAKKDLLDQIMFSLLVMWTIPEKAQKAFSAIKNSYVDWNEVRVTSQGELGNFLVSEGGNPNSAAPMKAFLQRVYRDNHDMLVEQIRKMPAKRARVYVASATGLSQERIGGTLLQVFGIPVITIGDQIKRVLNRMGLVEGGASKSKVQRTFMLVASKGKTATAHLLLQMLAREFCVKDTPLCPKCVVRKRCPKGQSVMEERRTSKKKSSKKKAAAKKKSPGRKKK